MLFPTVEFAIFFALVWALSWTCAGWPTLRKAVLVIASYVFYGWWNHHFVLLLFECTMGNYILGLWLEQSQNERSRKSIVALSMIVNLSVLAYFKYSGFFLATFHDLGRAFGLKSELKVIDVLLPVGISFYTFQGISYIVDIYRRELNAVANPLDMLLFKAFFPQLVAGPIVRASEFLPQLQRSSSPSTIRATRALLLIGCGLFKKVVVAHYLAEGLVSPAFAAPDNYGTLDLIAAVYGYAVQIYCDFSAYTDMAIGVALLFGFHFPTNFQQPYRAASLQDFWRRWHISLSTFLRDYLYVPLGGSRGSRLKTYRNLLLTMVLGGLWHGAAWTFVIWGLLHGIGLSIERAFRRTNPQPIGPWRRGLQILATFHVVCLAWIFFNAESLASALSFLRAFSHGTFSLKLLNPFTGGLLAFGLASQFLPGDLLERVEAHLTYIPLPVQATALAVVVAMVTALSPGALAPFIYFRF